MNPRQISRDALAQLKQSLEKFDYVELVAIQPDNTILAGHMRIKALLQLGRGSDEIEVRMPNRFLDKDEAKEYIIRSNKNTGEWDFDTLSSNFDMHDLAAWGFTADDLGMFIDEGSDEDNKKDGDEDVCTACGQKIKQKKTKKR